MKFLAQILRPLYLFLKIEIEDKLLSKCMEIPIYLIGPFSAGFFLTPAPLGQALIPPVLKMRLTPIRAGVKRSTHFSKFGVKGAAFFGPIFTPFWPYYGLWSLNVTKTMLLAYLFG